MRNSFKILLTCAALSGCGSDSDDGGTLYCEQVESCSIYEHYSYTTEVCSIETSCKPPSVHNPEE